MCRNPKKEYIITIIGPRGVGKTELKRLISHAAKSKIKNYSLNFDYQSTLDIVNDVIEVMETQVETFDNPGTSPSLKDSRTNKVYEKLREYAKSKERIVMYVVALYDPNYNHETLIEILKTDFEQIVESEVYKDSYFVLFINKMDLAIGKSHGSAIEDFSSLHGISQYISKIQSESRKFKFIIGSLKENPKKVSDEILKILIEALKKEKSC